MNLLESLWTGMSREVSTKQWKPSYYGGGIRWGGRMGGVGCGINFSVWDSGEFQEPSQLHLLLLKVAERVSI